MIKYKMKHKFELFFFNILTITVIAVNNKYFSILNRSAPSNRVFAILSSYLYIAAFQLPSFQILLRTNFVSRRKRKTIEMTNEHLIVAFSTKRRYITFSALPLKCYSFSLNEQMFLFVTHKKILPFV